MTDTATDERDVTPGASRVPALVSGVGVALLAVVVGEWAVFAGLGPGAVLAPADLARLLTGLPFVAGLIVGGRWLARSPLSPDRCRRVGGWTVGAMATLLAMDALAVVASGPWSGWVVLGWLWWAAAVGGGVGLFVGVVEARSVERVREATRARARAERLDSQRQWLDHLNAMLRHEVLNAATVIQGNVSLLLDEDPPAARRERLETIQRQCMDTAEAVEDIRALVRASEGTARFEPTDLRALLQSELRALRDRHPHVTTETDLPERLLVRADDLLSRAFMNLLANAVEHNDCDPVVTVEATRREGTAVVRVSDDGPGVPEQELAGLFERGTPDASSASHGMGLYLVDLLVERHGGQVALTDNGGGATFTVELPVADAEAGPEAEHQPVDTGPPASAPSGG